MTPLRVGELFSGIAGASLAVHAVIPGSVTLWQSDLVNERVRARHFPHAQQLVGDVRALDPSRLPRVDLLTAGFPCTDLSVAGKQAGLDGPASGLYREVLRFCGARADDLYAERPRVVYGGGYQPPRVLIENVPALLRYMPRLSADFRALGYGLTWTVCEAADAGLPHLRRRVFVLAELGVRGRGPVEVDHSARWQPENLRVWPTPRADEARTSGGRAGRGGDGESVTYAVRLWPTATVCGNDNREGASPTSGDGLGTAVRLWASPRASDADRGSDPDRVSGGKGGIVGQVRLWPTALAADGEDVKQNGIGSPALNYEARQRPAMGKRLNPAWVEALMNYPVGWTEPKGDTLPHVFPPPVRGRYPAEWDRSVPWPGFDWEPSRTLSDGPKARGRAARLKALGNSWVPAQGALALHALLGRGEQLCLL